MAYNPDTFTVVTVASLADAVTLQGTDVFAVDRGANSTLKTNPVEMASFPLPPVQLSGNTTLAAAIHNKRALYASSSSTLTIPTAATLGDGFACRLFTTPGTTVTFAGGNLFDMTVAAVTSMVPSKGAWLEVFNGAVNYQPF